MNLTPEQTPQQRAAGKADFTAEMQLSRREFIAAGGVAAGSLGAFYFGYETSVASPVRVGVLGTGDEGSVLIGAINPEFVDVRSIADIRPYNQYRAFHGDHYSDALLKVRCGLMAKYGWNTEQQARQHVKVYGDYHELIDNAGKDGIEAVIIALPLHLHAPAAIAAMRAGLHVLTEKLMGHSVHECKEMARVADQTHKYLATGHQRHYNILYDDAVDQIRRGLLGDVHYIRAQWHRGNLPGKDSWQQPMPEQVKPGDRLAKRLQSDLDKWQKMVDDLEEVGAIGEAAKWRKKVAQKEAQIADEVLAGTAKEYDYQDKVYKYLEGSEEKTYDRPAAEELIRWRLWERTGGGLMAELGSHQLDAASIFISAMHGGEKQYPLSVVAAANRPLFPQDRDVNDHVYCLFEFAAPGYDPKDPIASRRKIGVQYASINGNGFGGYGEIVFGTKGTLILEREKEAMLQLNEKKSSSVKVSASATMDTQESGPLGAAQAMGPADVSRGYTEQIEHFAWCIRKDPHNRNKEIRPRCHPKVAMADAVIALTTNIAAREGKRIEFERDWFEIDSDETPEGVKPDVTRYES